MEIIIFDKIVKPTILYAKKDAYIDTVKYLVFYKSNKEYLQDMILYDYVTTGMLLPSSNSFHLSNDEKDNMDYQIITDDNIDYELMLKEITESEEYDNPKAFLNDCLIDAGFDILKIKGYENKGIGDRQQRK